MKIDLHPSDYDENWKPPVGMDPLPGEKPHLWQEFKRDQNMTRRPGASFIGRGWPIFVLVLLIYAVQVYSATNGSPAWLLAIRNLF